MRIGKLIREVLSAGLLLTAGFHSVGYAQQNPESAPDNSRRGASRTSCWFTEHGPTAQVGPA